ncbi:hypothetical protein ACWDTT_36270 [Streptosporangium sandarakinum]
MSEERKLPKEIYYILGSRRNRPYANRGHVKQALQGRYWSELQSLRIYVVVVVVHPQALVPLDIGDDGWTDVTHEFITENGELKK